MFIVIDPEILCNITYCNYSTSVVYYNQGKGSEVNNMNKAQVKEAMAQGKAFEYRKLRYYGQYTAWKAISAERALHKLSVTCGEGFCPYQVRVAE